MTTKIKEMRKNKGITQEKLGIVLDLPQQKVSELELGKRKIKLDEAVKIADFLNVKVDDLVIRKN